MPEEFFDDETLILIGQVHWRCNWEVALENSMDSHVNYVHRNAVVVARTGFIARGAQGEHPIFVGNGFGGDVAESNYMRQNPLQDVYADGRKWPKTTYRRLLDLADPAARRSGAPPHSPAPVRASGAAATTCPACSAPSSGGISTPACACRSRST